jgi:hypothetical protein
LLSLLSGAMLLTPYPYTPFLGASCLHRDRIFIPISSAKSLFSRI